MFIDVNHPGFSLSSAERNHSSVPATRDIPLCRTEIKGLGRRYKHDTSSEVAELLGPSPAHSFQRYLFQSVNCFPWQFHLFTAHLCCS